MAGLAFSKACEIVFSGFLGKKVYYEGEIFREGVYAERGITVTREDVDFIASTTNPGVKIDFAHTETPFDKAMDGYGLERIEARDVTDPSDGSTKRILWARLSAPAWFMEALGEAIKVSVEFLSPIGKGKPMSALGAISVVDDPRVTTARLSAAFSKFSSKFAGGESYDDLRCRLTDALSTSLGVDTSSIQSDFWVCDLFPTSVVYHLRGALYERAYSAEGQGFAFGEPVEVRRKTTYEPVVTGQPDFQTAAPQGKAKETTRMNLITWLTNKFGAKAPKLIEEAGVTQEELEFHVGKATPTAQSATTPGTEDPALTAQFSAIAERMANTESAALASAARAFAHDVCYVQRKCDPSDLADFEKSYVDAVNGDNPSGSKFSATGGVNEGANVANLKKMVEKLPSKKHLYGENAIPDGTDPNRQSAPAIDTSSIYSARKKSMTPGGAN